MKFRQAQSTIDDPAEERSADFLSSLLREPAYSDPILIRDIIVVLLFAGRDNTQNSLAWALHALMKAPQWVTRMRIEARTNAVSDGVVRYENLGVGDSVLYCPCYRISLNMCVDRLTMYIWQSSTRLFDFGQDYQKTLVLLCAMTNFLPCPNTVFPQ